MDNFTSKDSDTRDYTKGVSEICPVHKIKMTKASIDVVYGLPTESLFEESQIDEKKFPFAQQFVLGGCVIGENIDVTVFHCSKCIKARKLWLKQKKKKRD